MYADFKPLTDEQWELILKFMELDLPLEKGVKRSDLRKVWNSIFFILRTSVSCIYEMSDFFGFANKLRQSFILT